MGCLKWVVVVIIQLYTFILFFKKKIIKLGGESLGEEGNLHQTW